VPLFGIGEEAGAATAEGKRFCHFSFHFQPLLWPDVGESPAPSFMIVYSRHFPLTCRRFMLLTYYYCASVGKKLQLGDHQRSGG